MHKHCKLNPRKAFHFCFHFFNRAKRIKWHGNSNQRCGRNASYVLVWVQRWMKTTCPKPVDLLLASYTYSCSNCFNLRTVSTAGPMFRSNSLHCCPVFPYTGRPGYSIQLRSHLRGKGFVVFLCVCAGVTKLGLLLVKRECRCMGRFSERGLTDRTMLLFSDVSPRRGTLVSHLKFN